jgi:hypothetical protein
MLPAAIFIDGAGGFVSQHMIATAFWMVGRAMSQDGIISSGSRRNPGPDIGFFGGLPPPWLVASAARFRVLQNRLNIVRPVRAVSFGGILVFASALAFLLGHSPDEQNMLVTASLFGLPLCLVVWFVASSVRRRLRAAANRIERQFYGAGMRLDDEGRVLTDDPHPILVFEPAAHANLDMPPPPMKGG